MNEAVEPCPTCAMAGLATNRRAAATRTSLFHCCVLSTDRVVNGDELAAVGEGGFDLDIVHLFLGDTFHHFRAGKDMGARFHQSRDALAVAGALQNEISNQCHGFRMIELHAPLIARPTLAAPAGRKSQPTASGSHMENGLTLRSQLHHSEGRPLPEPWSVAGP